MRYTATISTTHGRWYHYRVDRLHGIGIPENPTSHHHTLKSAQRSARRWTDRNQRTQTTTIERHQ